MAVDDPMVGALMSWLVFDLRDTIPANSFFGRFGSWPADMVSGDRGGCIRGKRTIWFIALDLMRAACIAGCGRDASERAERV